MAVLAAIGLLGAAAPARADTAARPGAVVRPAAAGVPVYLDTHYSFAERAADLVSRMTPAEKVAQLNTNSAPPIPRLGVQGYTYWSEGQHGINTLGADNNSGGVSGGVHATSFPTNFAATMSWDKALIYQETTAISDEIRGELDKSLWGTGQNNLGASSSDYGSLTFWAPTVNLDRDPRWGRTDEAFGEDPYLVGQMAGQFVDGYEGNTTTGASANGYLKVAATAKHYALNNVENNRTGISSDATDTDIRDYYTAQFRSLISNAHVSGLMTSYNAINGTPAVADTYTVNELAQRTYGFGGYITSDCGAIGTTYQNPPGGHDWAPPGWTTDNQGSNATWTNTTTGAKISGAAGGQAYALRAGTALNCVGFENTVTNIQAAINAGILSEGVIDTALTRVFTVRMETGEFDPAASVPYTTITKAQIQSSAHQTLAEQVAANSLVLLQNNTVTGTSKPLLPVTASALNKVVILGNLANTVTLGGYSGDPSLQVNAVAGITAAVHAANPNATIVYDAAGTSTTATGAATLSAATQAAIQSADLVVVFAGTDASTAGEGGDRTGLAMPGNYDSLINQTAALGNPRIALVIQSDGPVKIDDEMAKVPAIVFSGYNGESQGTALADVLTGVKNPSGHLDFTWYKDDTQLPAITNYGLTPNATGGLGRTYQYFTGAPTYPFGYGLSYTTFGYSPVTLDKSTVTADGTVTATFTVTNTGTVAGAAVAQLYVATPFTVSGVQLPTRRLEGFQKTAILAPGASQQVSLPVRVSDLSFWDPGTSKQVVYDGTYQFQLGDSSGHITSTATTAVTGAITPQVQYVTVQPESDVYNAGDTIDLTGKNQWIKDDTNPSLEQRNLAITADNVIMAVNNDESFVNLASATVTYASSNTAVATVTSAGLVHAVGDGTATITVTVNGVSGSVPIVVQHSLTLAAPALITAGGNATATTAFVNGSPNAETNIAVTMTPPSGWTATATTASTFASVAAGQRVTTTWRLTAPAGTGPGAYALSASASLTGAGPYTDAGTVNIAYASVAAAYGNVGISSDTATSAGNLDGGGASFSAQALAAAGFTPGSPVLHDGTSVTWPNVAAGVNDNIVASGQTVPLSGTGTTLGVYGASAYGTSSGAGTIVYTDGTTQAYSLSFADWWSTSPAQGSDSAATLPYINTAGGRSTQTVHMYYQAVPLTAGKTVQAVVLPYVSADASAHTVAMHVFALGVSSVSTPVISLRAHANGDYVTAENAGASPLIANRTAIGPWEEFDEIDLGNGNIALRAHANNEYVCADNTGTSPLIANRTAVGLWETFALIHNSDGSVSLKAAVNGDYVTAENAGASSLIANRTAIGPWEEFDLILD
jgi:beta-glucosidase-like glycosyl hydrolase